jgi:hypothetical protein
VLAVAAAAALAITTAGPIQAAPHVDGSSAVLELKGRAPRFAAVELRAACVLGPCTATTIANRRGRWAAPLNVVLPRGQRSVRVRLASGLTTTAARFALTYPSYALLPPYSDGAPAPQLAVIGDSLSVGADTPLRAGLPGWKVTTQGRVGRPLGEGMGVLDSTPTPPDGPLALAFSLFTNDDPTHVDELEAAVRASVERLGPRDCAIWATIVRPPVGGVSYAFANETLAALADEFAGRVLLVDWAGAIGRHRDWLSKDKVHPNATGYAGRARLYARAALKCQLDQGW